MAKALSRILVPVDGSPASAHAVDLAIKLAKATGAAISVIYIFAYEPGALVGLAKLSKAEADKLTARKTQEAVRGARRKLSQAKADYEEITTYGDPAEEIIGYARKRRASLIIMGRRGLSRIQELVLGSVSDKVLRYAPCPVTVVT